MESIATLTGRALRQFAVTFDDGAPTPELQTLDGVSHLAVHGRHLTFSLAGDIGPLLTVLARHHVSDLEVTRPSLEDAFAAYCGANGR